MLKEVIRELTAARELTGMSLGQKIANTKIIKVLTEATKDNKEFVARKSITRGQYT